MSNLTTLAKLTALAALAAIPFVANDARADLPVMQQATQQIMVSTWVPMDCTFLPHSEFPTIHVKNTTNAAIPKGTYIRYTLTTTTSSTSTVQTNYEIPAGQETTFGAPHLSQATCKATFNAGNPDIKVVGVRWTDPSTASVDLVNANPWIGTSAFGVRVGSFNCVSTPVKSVDSPALTLAKGELKTITLAIPKNGATYLKATADFDDKVKEANETNNVGTSSDFTACVAK